MSQYRIKFSPENKTEPVLVWTTASFWETEIFTVAKNFSHTPQHNCLKGRALQLNCLKGSNWRETAWLVLTPKNPRYRPFILSEWVQTIRVNTSLSLSVQLGQINSSFWPVSFSNNRLFQKSIRICLWFIPWLVRSNYMGPRWSAATGFQWNFLFRKFK